MDAHGGNGRLVVEGAALRRAARRWDEVGDLVTTSLGAVQDLPGEAFGVAASQAAAFRAELVAWVRALGESAYARADALRQVAADVEGSDLEFVRAWTGGGSGW